MFPKSKHALESLHRTENYREHLHEREGQCGRSNNTKGVMNNIMLTDT